MSSVTAREFAPAPSMSEYIQGLLEETPEVRDSERQRLLTDRFLTPVLPSLEALFRELRAAADARLRPLHPAPGAKPWPIGECLQISETVRRRLDGPEPAALSPAAAEGWAAVRAFRAAGGTVRRAWGDLRGRYFQNALIVGALYVDVSNDTVDPAKPPVEILPFEAAGFRPIAGFGHYARIAASYWGQRVLPNHILPDLAPYLPLIHISPAGRLSLGPLTRYMLGLTLAQGFGPSERALASPALSATTFASFAPLLPGAAASAEAGRADALARCRTYRAEGRSLCAESYNRALAAGREANRRLERVLALPQAS